MSRLPGTLSRTGSPYDSMSDAESFALDEDEALELAGVEFIAGRSSAN